jgi:catechol 2,3-dioxygenase-like lactoylglutathione lyase family enzyme
MREFRVTGIDHVQLAAPPDCEQAAREFFGGLLGMTELEKPAQLAGRGGVWFACGAQQLHVGAERPFAAAKKAHPAFWVTDVAALTSRLESVGVQVREDPLPGVTRIFCDDPFGNRLEFTEPRGGDRQT